MEFRVLKYFLTVAQEGSISKAAEILYVTQPTLSRQLMELEDELGTKLFIRGNRNITLTDAGIIFRRRAKEISALVRKSKNELREGELVSGDVYIGCGESEIMKFIARSTESLHKEYPIVRFHIYSGDADDITERLDKGSLDFGILFGVVNIIKYDTMLLNGSDRWGVLMREDCSFATRDVMRPEDLWELPLIVSRQAMVNDVISGWMCRNYEKLNIVSTYNLVYNASHLVREGLGYVICFDNLVNTGGDSQLCFKPLEPELKVAINIVWKKKQLFSKAANLFLEKMKEYAI